MIRNTQTARSSGQVTKVPVSAPDEEVREVFSSVTSYRKREVWETNDPGLAPIFSYLTRPGRK